MEGKKKQITKEKDLELGEEIFVVDPETGEIISPSNPSSTQENPDTIKESSKENPSKEEKHIPISASSPTTTTHQNSTLTFSDVIKSKKHKKRIMLLVKNKWPEVPKSLNDMEKFLREKHVEVDNIGTSDSDIEAWIKTIEDCR